MYVQAENQTHRDTVRHTHTLSKSSSIMVNRGLNRQTIEARKHRQTHAIQWVLAYMDSNPLYVSTLACQFAKHDTKLVDVGNVGRWSETRLSQRSTESKMSRT